jgi:hypothetical protein
LVTARFKPSRQTKSTGYGVLHASASVLDRKAWKWRAGGVEHLNPSAWSGRKMFLLEAALMSLFGTSNHQRENISPNVRN